MEKGKRYLERSYNTRNIESTDGENSNPSKEPVILSEKTIKKSLQDVPTMFSSLQSKENNNDTPATKKITTESHTALGKLTIVYDMVKNHSVLSTDGIYFFSYSRGIFEHQISSTGDLDQFNPGKHEAKSPVRHRNENDGNKKYHHRKRDWR